MRPTKNIECIALVKPGSKLAREWKFAKPTYGIYQYDLAFAVHELGFGDGSWCRLDDEQMSDVILLESLSAEIVEELFA